MSDTPKNAPKGLKPLKGPMVVRHREAARFLWGDEKSGEVADVIYGRNEVIGTLIFKLKPGGYFRSSDTWKSFFDQDRFYFVLKGEIAVQDPETGEVAMAKAGEAVHWRGAKWHFGYNFRSEECWVLDWYAPQERPTECHRARIQREQAEVHRRKNPARRSFWVNGRYPRRRGRRSRQGRHDHRDEGRGASLHTWREASDHGVALRQYQGTDRGHRRFDARCA